MASSLMPLYDFSGQGPTLKPPCGQKIRKKVNQLTLLATKPDQRTMRHPASRLAAKKFGKNSKNRIFLFQNPSKSQF